MADNQMLNGQQPTQPLMVPTMRAPTAAVVGAQSFVPDNGQVYTRPRKLRKKKTKVRSLPSGSATDAAVETISLFGFSLKKKHAYGLALVVVGLVLLYLWYNKNKSKKEEEMKKEQEKKEEEEKLKEEYANQMKMEAELRRRAAMAAAARQPQPVLPNAPQPSAQVASGQPKPLQMQLTPEQLEQLRAYQAAQAQVQARAAQPKDQPPAATSPVSHSVPVGRLSPDQLKQLEQMKLQTYGE